MYDESVRARFWAKVAKHSADVPAGCWEWTGARAGTGYGYAAVNRRVFGAHRISYELATGAPIPAGMVVDHRCGTRACVNPDHLRLVTNKQNTEHRTALNRNNRSGFRGVSFKTREGKWQAQVKHAGRIYASFHDTPEEAAEAAKQLRNELYTHNDLDRVTV